MHPTSSKPPLSYHFMRIALGFVYFHFGILKFFPDLSPAELLAGQTIMRLTGGLLSASDALFILAIMEVALGVALILNVWMRLAFVVFVFHMIGTFSPIFVLPELAFKIFPFAPTLEGQYILKNVVFVVAGWALLAPHLFTWKAPAFSFLRVPAFLTSVEQPPEMLQPAFEEHHRQPVL